MQNQDPTKRLTYPYWEPPHDPSGTDGITPVPAGFLVTPEVAGRQIAALANSEIERLITLGVKLGLLEPPRRRYIESTRFAHRSTRHIRRSRCHWYRR